MSSQVFYIDDYGPITVDILDIDGLTPITPIDGRATIVNQHTGEAVVQDAACVPGEGTLTYIVPSGSAVTSTTARYVAYLTADIDATTSTTVAVVVDVLDKGSYLIVDRWRRKVEFASPDEDAISDQEGRDWIDQAVQHLNSRYFDTGYTSVLAALTPNAGVAAAGPNEIEFIASVASLMARTSWYAGKGNWRDEEMSLDTGPLHQEWERLVSGIISDSDVGWFDVPAITDQQNMRNRDRIDRGGIPHDIDQYYYDNIDYWFET